MIKLEISNEDALALFVILQDQCSGDGILLRDQLRAAILSAMNPVAAKQEEPSLNNVERVLVKDSVEKGDLHNFILAIKSLRCRFNGLGLSDAKALCDAYRDILKNPLDGDSFT